MKELISECPNIVPVGLGNNTSEIDMSTYVNGFNSNGKYESSRAAEVEMKWSWIVRNKAKKDVMWSLSLRMKLQPLGSIGSLTKGEQEHVLENLMLPLNVTQRKLK
jgi:hypothetical protein